MSLQNNITNSLTNIKFSVNELKSITNLDPNESDSNDSFSSNSSETIKFNLDTTELLEISLSLLYYDFLRFSRQHSWYKHIPFEGKIFYFYLEKGEQIRNGFETIVNDPINLHWHFYSIKPKDKKYAKAKLGPFLRGDTLGFDIIIEDYTENKFNKWINKKYPEYMKNINLNEDPNSYDIQDKFEKHISVCEKNKYWNRVKKAFYKTFII